MKHKFLILLTSILFLSFTKETFKIKKSDDVSEKILLIKYWEDSDFKVLKDYKNVDKQFKYVAWSPLECEPKYNGLNKTLDLDEGFKITNMSKIILWTCGRSFDISLPFHYEHIIVDSLVNDSTFRFRWFNKKHLSIPGEIISDTIISIEKKGERVIQYTKIYNIYNYGLIDKKNIFTCEEQVKRMEKENERNRIQDSIERAKIFELFK